VRSRGKQVCSCFNVGEPTSTAVLAASRIGAERTAARAGHAEMRHQLRLLRARAQAHGALRLQAHDGCGTLSHTVKDV
jgi:hypothetical protein